MTIIFILSSLVILIFAYWVFRIIVRRDYQNLAKLSPLSYILETVVFALHANLIYLAWPSKWPFLPTFTDDRTVSFLFGFFLIIGLGILMIAWFGLGTKTSFGQDKNKLQTAGLYRYSRNPQLVGYGIVLIAFTILFSSWQGLVWMILYFPISYFMVLSEEEFLHQQYGDEYRDYCKRTGRIF